MTPKGKPRGLRVAWGHAWLRVRNRKAEFFSSAIGIGLAIAGLFSLAMLPTVIGEQTIRQSLSDLPVAERTVSMAFGSDRKITPPELRGFDQRLRQRFANSGLGPLRRLVQFRALAASDGSVFRLSGVEGFGTALKVVEGRDPKACHGDLCEVVLVADEPTVLTASMNEPLPGIRVVGRAIRTDGSVFTGDFGPDDRENLIVANGTEGLGDVRALELIRRVVGWVAPIETGAITQQRVKPLLASMADATNDVDRFGFAISAPDEVLGEALARSAAASRALALPAGQVVAILMAAVALVALGRKSAHTRASDRLSRRGAGSALLRGFALADSALVVFAGLLIGVSLSIVGAIGLAYATNVPTSEVIGSLSKPGVLVGVPLVAIAMIGCIASIMRSRPPDFSARRIRTSDIVGVGAVILLILLLSRGSATASSLTDAPDVALWATPILVAVVLTGVAARVVPATLRWLGHRLLKRRPLDAVALREATTKSAAPLAATVMLAIAMAFATFSLCYRSTLSRSAQDQATFAVPYDAALKIGSALVRPLATKPKRGWSSLATRTIATDVLRRSISVFRNGTEPDIVEVLALDPKTLPSLRSWRRDYGPPLKRSARLLSVSPPKIIGQKIPIGTTALRVTTSGNDVSFGVNEIVFSIIFERADGTWFEEVAEWSNRNLAIATLKNETQPMRFIGFRAAERGEAAKRVAHNSGEGRNTAVGALGIDFTIDNVQAVTGAGTRRIPISAKTLASSVATLTAQSNDALRVEIELQGTSALIVPPVEEAPLPVLVDRITASTAEDGIITGETNGTSFEFRVAAVVDRFPTMGSRFIVVDLGRLSQRFNLVQPTNGTPNELWIGSTDQEALAKALNRPEFRLLDKDFRVTRVNRTINDPIARAALGVLVASTLLAVLLAMAAIGINTRRERTDDAAFYRALLLEGAGDKLRRITTVRSIALVALALPLGLLAGRWLAQLVVGSVQLTATADNAVPPLLSIYPWLTIVLVLGVLSIAVLGTARLSQRGTAPHNDLELIRGAP